MRNSKLDDPRRPQSSRRDEEARRQSGQPGAEPRQKGESLPKGEGADEDRDRPRRDTGGRQDDKSKRPGANRRSSHSRPAGEEAFKPFSRHPESHPGKASEELERDGSQANRDPNLGGDAVKSSSEAPGREVIDERRRLRQTVPPGKI